MVDCDIQCLIIDLVFIFPFCDFTHHSVMVEIRVARCVNLSGLPILIH